jgi:membrane-associated phospholipid phosphatase
MPSMHIAMACWAALSLRAYSRRMQWVGWTYVGLIWFSSVHLGWHYVSDGAVGIVGALLVWRLAGAIGAARVSNWLPHEQLQALTLKLTGPLIGRLAGTKSS